MIGTECPNTGFPASLCLPKCLGYSVTSIILLKIILDSSLLKILKKQKNIFYLRSYFKILPAQAGLVLCNARHSKKQHQIAKKSFLYIILDHYFRTNFPNRFRKANEFYLLSFLKKYLTREHSRYEHFPPKYSIFECLCNS